MRTRRPVRPGDLIVRAVDTSGRPKPGVGVSLHPESSLVLPCPEVARLLSEAAGSSWGHARPQGLGPGQHKAVALHSAASAPGRAQLRAFISDPRADFQQEQSQCHPRSRADAVPTVPVARTVGAAEPLRLRHRALSDAHPAYV